jgi:hypothetical protein
VTTLFTITKDDEFEGASVILSDGTVLPVSSDHPRYSQIVASLIEGADESTITKLVNPAQAAYGKLTRLSERVTRKGNTLFFDGDALGNALAKHIVRIMDEAVESGDESAEEDSWKAYVNFLEKLQTNPSKKSKKHLYTFIEAHGITIHPDGDILLYKGTQADGKSKSAGYGIVDGVVIEHGYLPNAVGSVVEIPRSMVDDDRERACSTGLHAGTYSYANSFGAGGKLFMVKINPRDVVSVPSDAQDQKVRVARYEVLEENEFRTEYRSTVWAVAPSEDAEDEDWDEEDPAYEDNEPEDEDEDALSIAPVVADTVRNARPEGSRVEEYKALIKGTLIPNGISLGRFKGRNVTAGRRAEFQQAMDELGLSN